MLKRAIGRLLFVLVFALGNISYATDCKTDNDCTTAAQPVCGRSNACVECNSDRDCRGTLICTANHQCKKEPGEAISSCGCRGAFVSGAIFPASNCASGTRTVVACGGLCPDGKPPQQFVCN